MVAGRPGVPGLSVAETAAEEFEAERGPATAQSRGTEVRPAWVQLRSFRSVTSLPVQWMAVGPAGHLGLSAL